MASTKARAVAMVVLAAAIVGGWSLAAQSAVAAQPAPAVDDRCPKPAKDNSFAQDTWLRRNRHPLKIKLMETDGRGGENIPVTLSVACGEGDYPAGKLCPVLAGRPLAAQVDVLATWPSDQSVKHAVVSLLVPKIGSKECLEFSFTQAAPPAPGKFIPAVDPKALSFGTEFENTDGKTTVTAIDADTLGRMADILAGKIAGEEATKLAPRLCGPLCYEFEVKVPAKTGEAADADIDVYYRLRVYSGVKGVRVEYDVENTRIPVKPYPAKFTVTDRAFARAIFQAGPADKPTTVYEQEDLVHWFATRYRICRWWGEQPVGTFAKENAAYLIYSEFFPKIDLDHPLSEAELAARVTNMRKAKWYREPAEFPDGVPLSSGPNCPWMGNYGGRPEIGCYPLWALLALASNSPAMLHYVRLSEGNGMAAYPTHIRPPENDQPGVSWDDPMRLTLYVLSNHADNVRNVRHVRIGKGCPNSPDTGHVPDVAYYTYLATGEKFYEEEMAFWAAAMLWCDKGHLPSHDRYSAWPLRNATDAAFVLPDRHPMKQYFFDCVRRTIAYQGEAVKDPKVYWSRETRRRQSSKDYVCSATASLWQECFNIWALDNAARKGFYPAAATVREAEAELLYRIYEGREEFKAPDGKIYRWANPAAMIPYHAAVDVRRLDCTNPKKIKDVFIKTITDNTGAMYYYTIVNRQHAFKGDAAFAATLPKQIMEPEDWTLDPQFARKCGEEFSWYVVDINGNGPTSAALARYDNPRARRMYEFVRELLEKKLPAAKRVRGIELVN